MKNICLVGVGPHAKRIYFNYFKKHEVNLSLVVDLESKKDEIINYLKDNNFNNTKILTLNDKYKDNENMPSEFSKILLSYCNKLKITHFIIATEPKAHYMYTCFCLKNNINVLTDKPISVVKGMDKLSNIKKVRDQYYNILKLEVNSTAKCKVMCQRQYHRGYEYIKKLLTDVVKKYQIPITSIDIYHCDGNWEMPHDLLKENHPYKYGYGKLYHSGYHFIDLLSDFLKINDLLDGTKQISKGQVYSEVLTPSDELNICNIEDYKRIFKDQNIPEYYNNNSKPNFKNFGEKNYHGLLKFSNLYNQVITIVNLNLLHYGFSRRAWIESKDYYKSNGRIRHEYININVGTLMNIKVHSYQSKEIKDRTLDEENVGGLEHFDIEIYRNSDLIGGKPFELVKLGDMYTKKEKKDFLGYNELSREIFINNFLSNKSCKGDIKDQAMAIEILNSCSKGIYNHYKNVDKVEVINMKNEYTYPVSVLKLKQYATKINKNIERSVINYAMYNDKNYMYYTFIQRQSLKNVFECYLAIDDNNADVSASPLLYKKFTNYKLAYLYYVYLQALVNYKGIKYIYKKLINAKVKHK